MVDDSLNSKLKEKLQKGEISQEEYDYFHSKFRKLGILIDDHNEEPEKVKNILVSGVKTMEGGIYKQIISRGRLVIQGNTECQKLSVTGSMDIEGGLTVFKSSSISGSLTVAGDAKFLGPMSSTGSTNVSGMLIAASKLSSSGELHVEGDIVTDNHWVFNGKLNCKNIRSSSKIKLSGNISITGDVIAEEFVVSKGEIKVGGDIKAKKINIASSFTEIDVDFVNEFEDIKNLSDLIQATTKFAKEIVPNVGGLLSSFMDNIVSPDSHMVTVNGNIDGNEVKLSNAIIEGEVIGDDIVLGRNLKIKGQVKYRNSINKSQYEGISIHKIN
ncbi:MAG: hypothetical protein HeimC2_01130 [Candidatus Heimdallarchaeota archaeon LC_2]|nr:MAG: hypothetical protein HeimC2_01130 [Candidatus Heimdallarchaeota archaeon LC_2]